jgi:steroid delta-isomerase-like uncharacterized protein
MAEKENLRIAEEMTAAVNAHDIDRCLQLFDESYVGESELTPAGAGQGRAGVRQRLETLIGAFPDVQVEDEQTLASGDFVVVRARVTGTHKGNFAGIPPTNKRVSWGVCNVVEFRNGKVIRVRQYADNASLFQQLGVLALPRPAAAG